MFAPGDVESIPCARRREAGPPPFLAVPGIRHRELCRPWRLGAQIVGQRTAGGGVEVARAAAIWHQGGLRLHRRSGEPVARLLRPRPIDMAEAAAATVSATPQPGLRAIRPSPA